MHSETVQELAAFCGGRKIRCAVVESDNQLRNIISRVFRDLGMTVFDAKDGRQMVVEHCRQPFDLLILRWRNDGLSSEMVLESMKVLSDQMPKLIVMTGQESVSISCSLPVAGFLFLPFDVDKLASVVLTVLGGQDARS